jgi:hypothetical protein
MFEGRRPAVDQLLIDDGRLEVLERPDDFVPPDMATSQAKHWEPDTAPLHGFVERILEAMHMRGSPERSGRNGGRPRDP